MNETNNAQVCMTDSKEVFAVPGAPGIIDCVNPATGLSWVYGHTLEQIRERYPKAERIAWAEWTAVRVSQQDTPITWEPSTAEDYDDMLNVLPPAFWQKGLFLVGEPMDHHAGNGQPRFSAYLSKRGEYYTATRPITIAEAKAVVQMLHPFGK